MKRFFIISLVMLAYFAGKVQAQSWDANLWGPSLIDQTGFISDPTLGQRKNFADGSWFQGILDQYGNPKMGTYQLANGDVYVGNISNMQRNGMGVYTLRNGSWQMGEWVNGVPNGTTSFYDATTGTYYDQVFRNGELISSKQVSRPTYDKNSWNNIHVSDAPVNSNSSSSYSGSSSSRSSRSNCRFCGGTGRLKITPPQASGYGVDVHYYKCNECGETSVTRHTHINCNYCR